MWQKIWKIFTIFVLIHSISGGFEENAFLKPEDYSEDDKILPVYENESNKRGFPDNNIESLLTDKAPDWFQKKMTNSTSNAKIPVGIPPEIVEQPEDTYIVRNRPATLTCKALHAERISFKCNGDWVRPVYHTNSAGVDQKSGYPYLQSSIPIHRKEVEAYFGFDGFQCECFAWAQTGGTVKSNLATVRTAYLKRHFQSQPANERKPVDSTIELPCLPPEGKPNPRVFWLKNGNEIFSRLDPNVIIANDGSLLIAAARLSDTGNYTCGAENVANRRLTDPVQLQVYVDGQWTQWGAWSGSCNFNCDQIPRNSKPPALTRARSCTNPPAKNGGKSCPGPADEQMDCPLKCPVDGGWSPWSKWDPCDSQCKQFRTRSCTNPRPKFDGLACVGNSTEFQDCKVDECREELAAGANLSPNAKVTAGPIENESDSAAMYIGIGAAAGFLAVFLLILFAILIRKKTKKRRNENFYAASEHGMLQQKVSLNHVLGMQPDLTSNVLLMYDETKKYPPSDFGSFSLMRSTGGGTLNHHQLQNHSQKFCSPQIYRAGSRNALLVEGGSTSSSSNGTQSKPPSLHSNSTEKRRNFDGTPQKRSISSASHRTEDEEGHYATLYDLEPQAVESCGIPDPPKENVNHSFVWGKISSNGGRLEVSEGSVALQIPEGALSKVEKIFIGVSRDPIDSPKLRPHQTLLSPVILLGPSQISCEKSIVLSMEHCIASVSSENSTIRNWNLHLFADVEGEWRKICTVGEENLNTPVYAQVDPDRIHVMLDYLYPKIVLIGESKRIVGFPPATKRMRLAVFGPSPQASSSLDCTLRVYCVEDTRAALQGVLREESESGQLLDDSRPFSFQDGPEENSLCLCLEDLSPGWSLQPGANFQEIPASHVWVGRQLLHCSFTVTKNEEKSAEIPQVLLCRLLVYQRHSVAAQRQVFHIECSSNHFANRSGSGLGRNGSSTHSSLRRPESAVLVIPSSASIRSNSNQLPLSVGFSSSADASKVFQLPVVVKRKLCQLLDTPVPEGNDWRMLAKGLGVDRYINYFAVKSSPTESIFDLWEARCRDPGAAVNLIRILLEMQRPDAAAVVDAGLQKLQV